MTAPNFPQLRQWAGAMDVRAAEGEWPALAGATLPLIAAPEPLGAATGPWAWPDRAPYVDWEHDPAGVLVCDVADVDSKFGFGDGDMLAEPVTDWARAHGWQVGDGDSEGRSWPYVSDRMVLWHVVQRLLLPHAQAPLGSRIEWVGGVHNPVREWADGVRWLSSEVTVSAEEFGAVCQDLFPRRDAGWLGLYRVVRGVVCPYGMSPSEFEKACQLTERGYGLLGAQGAVTFAHLRSTLDPGEVSWARVCEVFAQVWSRESEGHA